jgi:hypothetical protein
MKRTLLTLSLIGVAALCPVAFSAGAQAQTPLPRGMASSFNTTAEQAIVKQTIHDAGYAGVTDLQHNEDGSWHAQAMKNNSYVDVTVDRAGHVSP